MKKIILIVTVIISITVLAQKEDAPILAKTAFAKNFPGASKIKWEKENGNYEVSFVQNGQELSALYTAKGIMTESEKEIKVAELPASILEYMKGHYKGVTVKGAARITKADGTIVYEAAIKGKDVLFDANGRFLKEAKD